MASFAVNFEMPWKVSRQAAVAARPARQHAATVAAAVDSRPVAVAKTEIGRVSSARKDCNQNAADQTAIGKATAADRGPFNFNQSAVVLGNRRWL